MMSQLNVKHMASTVTTEMSDWQPTWGENAPGTESNLEYAWACMQSSLQPLKSLAIGWMFLDDIIH